MSGAESKVDALVVPVSAQDLPYAITVAEHLRKSGLVVEIDIRDRSVAGNFRYADRRKMPFAVVVGSEESAASVVVLKDLVLRTTQRLPVSDAALQVQAARSRS
jgi:histidyl-tRNA synthetase